MIVSRSPWRGDVRDGGLIAVRDAVALHEPRLQVRGLCDDLHATLPDAGARNRRPCGAFFDGWGRPSIHTVCGARSTVPVMCRATMAPEIGSTSGSMRKFCGPMTMCRGVP